MKYIISVLLLLFTGAAQAQELSARAFFNRCYTQLTGRPVPLGHALMNSVASGKTNALQACKTILNKGSLVANGQLSSPSDVEAKAVLNHFYAFHRNWFPANNFDTVPGYNSSEHLGNPDIYDTTEPALAVTMAMFGLNQKYSAVLTRAKGVSAIRSSQAAIDTRLGYSARNPSRYVNKTVNFATAPFTFRATNTASTKVSRDIQVHESTIATMPTLEVGDLIGVKETTNSFTVPNISLQTGSNNTDKGSLYASTLNYSYDFFKTYGGGVLGTPIYLLQYYGHGYNMKFNGQSKLARRWSQQNMESFLCASLPALRESDVADMVDTKSSAAFRQARGCIMCHATLDPMAYTARNLTVGSFDTFRPTQIGPTLRDADGNQLPITPAYYRHATAITSYKATKSSVTGWPSAEVPEFHLQKPTGRLYFRSVTGTLINKNVNDMNGLGTAMADTDDFYMCAAKRYFEFFTGIVVPLYDRTNPNNASLNLSLTPDAVADREYVEYLAKNLRSSQSVIKLVEDIMGSRYYSQENFR